MARGARPSLRIGTSGFVYPHWRGALYPPKLAEREWLPFYARHFDTVELNTTFYRLPTERAANGWAAGAPSGFLFAIKGSRYLTHVKRLRDTARGVGRFFDALKPLAGKVGPILWQLPPQMKPDIARLAAFLQALPAGFERVVELRNPDWYSEAVFQTLDDHGASLCLHDLLDAEAPFPPPGRLYYRRFHGALGAYSGPYGAERLAPVAAEIVGRLEAGVPCFAYFNNDASADAVFDALDLVRQVRKAQGHRAQETRPPWGV